MVTEKTSEFLRATPQHPYIGRPHIPCEAAEKRILALNHGREGHQGDVVTTTYYVVAKCGNEEFGGIEYAIKMMLIHGTTENWDDSSPQPDGYAGHMSRLKSIGFLGVNHQEQMEAALVTIVTPLTFFDQADKGFPLTQLRMATSAEPFNAFSDYTARVVDYILPEKLKQKFVGQVWPHRRIRQVLEVDDDEPILGTIVKPKWLPCELFAQTVLQCADAGARFVKSDENLHLARGDLEEYVRLTVRRLEANGYGLSTSSNTGKRPFLFAPHITASAFEIVDRAKTAVDAGANALMFSPHFSGDFEVIRQIYDLGQRYRVPIFSHCAGMNRFTGDPNYAFGEDPRTVYLLAALSGVAFMQLPAAYGYVRPNDVEKKPIVERLRREGLEGNEGMTLVIAGGLSARNVGYNIKLFGAEGKLFLAGTSVSHHPDGIAAGFAAIKLAVAAAFKGIVDHDDLKAHAVALGEPGRPLLRAIES